jgi:hypothetical protein
LAAAHFSIRTSFASKLARKTMQPIVKRTQSPSTPTDLRTLPRASARERSWNFEAKRFEPPSLASEEAPGKRYVEEGAALIQQYKDAPFALVGKSLGVQFAMGTVLEITNRSNAAAPVALFCWAAACC